MGDELMLNGMLERILEAFRTEVLMARLTEFDPFTTATNPYVIGGAILIVGALCALRMLRTLAVLVGLLAIWVAVFYALPHEQEDLNLENIGTFVSACVGVIALWAYVFFVRSD
jgi:hypothetical protein